MLLWMCQLLKHVQQQQLLGLYTHHSNMNQSCNGSRKLSVEALLPISFIRTFMQVYFSALTFRMKSTLVCFLKLLLP